MVWIDFKDLGDYDLGHDKWLVIVIGESGPSQLIQSEFGRLNVAISFDLEVVLGVSKPLQIA